MAHLRIKLLGSPLIDVDGHSLVVDTRMAVALLAYLALNPDGESRDTLAALLWPEYDQSNARANLRRTLSALRHGLGGRWIEAAREHIALERAQEVSIDVDEFRGALHEVESHAHPATEVCAGCVEPLTRAAALCRGPFLAGFTLRESPAFDDWQAGESDAQQRQLSTVLERLTGALAAHGDFAAAIPHAKHWLTLDRLHEPAHCRLMLLFAWAGDRSAAVRQYRECVRTLDEELGVAPLAATTQLFEAILAGNEPGPCVSISAAHLATVQPATPASRGWPLFGRDEEWRVLLDTFARIKDRPLVVAVQGEAGVGKSRLAQDFIDHVRSRAHPTLALRCYAGETHQAYAPVSEVLRSAFRDEACATRIRALPRQVLAEVGRLLPELALDAADPIQGPGAHERFVDALLQVLRAVLNAASDSTPAVLVDDAQWIDEASFELVSRLARSAAPMCLLLAFRPEDVSNAHPVRRLLAELRRAGCLTQLDLGRLTVAETEQLSRALVPDLPRDTVADVVRRTEGLPFFVVEYVRAAAENPMPDHLPIGVRELLQSRLEVISELTAQVLAAAAVIGHTFDLDTLRGASGRAEEELTDALEELTRRGLVHEITDRERGGMYFDFTHDWLREVVYSETSLSRRRLLHRRVAEAIAAGEADSPPAAQAAQIAWHYQQAGHDARAAVFAVRAGEYARGIYATEEAIHYFERALALGHPDIAALREAMGDLQMLVGEYAAALKNLELAAALCRDVDMARLEHKLAALRCRRGEWDLARNHFLSAEAELARCGDESARARLYADWSVVAMRTGDHAQATLLASKALESATAAGDTRALFAAHNALGILALRDGQLETSLSHHLRGLALAELLNDNTARIASLNNVALARRAAGKTDAAMQATGTALELCERIGDRHRAAALHSNLADLLYASGQHEEALVHLKQAATLFTQVGSFAEELHPEIWKLTEW